MSHVEVLKRVHECAGGELQPALAYAIAILDASFGDDAYRAELQRCRDLCVKLNLNMQFARDVFAMREEARAQGRASKEAVIAQLEAEALTSKARIAELEAARNTAQTLCARQEREIDHLEDDLATLRGEKLPENTEIAGPAPEAA